MRIRWKAWLHKFWNEWAKPMAVVVVVLCSLRSAVADWNDVPTGSMRPTILEGDRILVNKLAYGLRLPFSDWWLMQWDGPQRGDVVICFAPDSGARLVKRVIGLPGDRIELRNNRLFINDQPAGYEPLEADTLEQIAAEHSADAQRTGLAAEDLGVRTHPIMITPAVPARRSFGPMTVPAGQYLVLGDNRDNSRDSRFFGCIPRQAIVGRVSRVVLSVDPDRHYLPRWGRFFKELP